MVTLFSIVVPENILLLFFFIEGSCWNTWNGCELSLIYCLCVDSYNLLSPGLLPATVLPSSSCRQYL